MEQDHLLFYLETLHKSLGIPIVYGEGSQSVRHFQPFSVTTNENELDFIVQRLQGVFAQLPNYHAMYLLHPRLILLGLARNPETDTFIFIGPLAMPHTREEDIADYLFFAGLSAEAIKQLSAYLNAAKIWTVDMFKHLLLNINLALNGEMLSENELGQIEDRETELRHQFQQRHFSREAEEQDSRDAVAAQDFTDRLNYCLMHGDVVGMANMLTHIENAPFTSEVAVVPAHMKQIAYGSVFASESVALKSGIPAANLKVTKQYYLDRIDRAASAEEYRRLSVGAMFDMAKCVKEYLSEKTENPAIRRAVEYIKENLNTKLLAEDIARAVHVSPHYLFTKFKKETGKTLTEFINEEKIKKACYYIVFTDNSFSEIANFLSFSSQSYFQSVFKKVMGQTPNEWKQSNRDISF